MAITYNNLYLDIRRRLREAGVEAARLEAREIVCHAAGKSREHFLADMNLYASRETEDQAMELLRRRLEGEPVAYLLGEWNFYGLDLDVDSTVLIPRFDTEIVAEQAICRAQQAGEHPRVMDLCTGTGCIGLAVAANVPNSRVVLGDLSPDALRISEQNIRRTNLRSRVNVFSVNALEKPAKMLWTFDVLVSNPPYIPSADISALMPSVRNYEPAMALDGGEDGLDFYRAITRSWKEAIRPGGWLIYEVGIHQAEDVMELLRQEGFQEVSAYADTGDILRAVEGRRPLAENS